MSVTLSINGLQIQAQPGTTVLEAAKSAGLHVPTLCWLPKLKPFGACRLCVVEIEGLRGFPTACTVPVADGMIVRTETDAVKNLRRETLALILSEHPYSCLACAERSACLEFQSTIRKVGVTTGCQYCPKSLMCELQKLVDDLGLQDIPYPISYRGLAVEKDDPFYDRDYNLCILCGRCVRVCSEVRHLGVLAFTYRGNRALVGTAFGRSHLETDCEFCGSCVDACPTGALFDKRGKWEGKPQAVVASVCPHCSVGCAINLQVKNGKVVRAVGHDEGPANAGELCVRGRFGIVDVVHSLARLKTPLLRRNGRLVEVPWDLALDAAAQGFRQHTGDQFATIGSASATNEENYLLQKFARAVQRSHNVALAGGFPQHSGEADLLDSIKTINGPALRDVREAAAILVIGANLFESHPLLDVHIRHALSLGARLITVDPRETKMTRRSALWLQPKPGSDHVLVAGIIKALGSTADDFGEVDLDRVAELTGVQSQAILAAAELLGKLSPSVILYGSGVTDYPTAGNTLRAISSLAALCHARVIGVPGEGNLVGAYDMGLHPALLPGYRPVVDAQARADFEAAWKAPLSPAPGRGYREIVEGIRGGQVQALYLAGEMPPLPELAKLSLLVVQDIVSSELTRCAHVVLPATTFAETDGTLTNLEGRVQRVRAAIVPVGEARPGWQIVRDLARRLGPHWPCESAADVMAEIAALVPAYAAAAGHELGLSGTVRRFHPLATTQMEPFSLDNIPTFADADFPLTLIAERNLFHHRGVSLTEGVKGMSLVKHEEVVHLNPGDAARLGIADKALVEVVSAHGAAECTARLTDGVPVATAFISINRLAGSAMFPALAPGVKACGARVRNLERPSVERVT